MQKTQYSSWDSIHPASLSTLDMHGKINASSQSSAKPFRASTDPLFSFLKDYKQPLVDSKEGAKTETTTIKTSKPEKEPKDVVLPRRYVLSAKGGVVASDVFETKQEHEDEEVEKGQKNFKDDQQAFEIELPWSYSPSAEFQKVYGLSLRAQNGFFSPFFLQEEKQGKKEDSEQIKHKKNTSSLLKREQLENEHELDKKGREEEEEEEEKGEKEEEEEEELSESDIQARHFSRKQKEQKAQELEKQIQRVGFVPILYKPLKAVVSDTTERPQLLKVAKHIGINLKSKKCSYLASKENLLNQIYKTLMAQNKYYNNEDEVTDTFGQPILENYKQSTLASDPYTIKTIKKTTTTTTRHNTLGFRPKVNRYSSTKTFLTQPVITTTTRKKSLKTPKPQFRLNAENEPQAPPTDPSWFSSGVSEGPSGTARPTQALAYSSLFPPVSNPVGTYTTGPGQGSSFTNFLSSTPRFDQIRDRFNRATIQLFLTSPDFQILGMPDSITLLNLKHPGEEDSYGALVKRVENILEVGTKKVLSADDDEEGGEEEDDGDEDAKNSGGIHIHKVFLDLMIPENKKKGPHWQERRMKDMIRYRNMDAQLRTREMFNLVLNPTDENLVSLRDLLDTTPRNKFDMNLVLPQEYDGQNALMVAISAGDFFDENKNPLLAVLTLLSAHFVSTNPSPLPPLNLNATDNSGYNVLMHTTTLCHRIKQRIDQHVKMVDQLTDEQKEARQEIEPDDLIKLGSSRAMKLCHAIIFVLCNVEISVANFLRHSSQSKSKISLFSISTMKKACKRNEYSVNPNMDVDGVTAAGIAVKHACILCLRMLQKYSPSLSLAKADQKTGRTPLHEAGRLCNALLFFLVLKSDVDYFALDNDKNTVFHTVARHDWDAWKRYWPDQADADLWRETFDVKEEVFDATKDSIMTLLWVSFKKFANSFASVQFAMNNKKAKNQSFLQTQTSWSQTTEEEKSKREILMTERNLIKDVIDRVNAEGVTILMMSALKRDLKSVEFELETAHADPTVLSPTTCMRGSNKGCSILFMMTQLLNPDITPEKKSQREQIVTLLETATKRVESTRNLMRRRWLESRIPHFQKPSSSSSSTKPNELGIDEFAHPNLTKSSETLWNILKRIVEYIEKHKDGELAAKIVEFLYAYWNKEVGCNMKELDAIEKKIYLANRRRLASEKGIEKLSLLLEDFEMESNYSGELCQELENYLKTNSSIKEIFQNNKPYQDLLQFHTSTKDPTGSNDSDEDDDDEDEF